MRKITHRDSVIRVAALAMLLLLMAACQGTDNPQPDVVSTTKPTVEIAAQALHIDTHSRTDQYSDATTDANCDCQPDSNANSIADADSNADAHPRGCPTHQRRVLHATLLVARLDTGSLHR